MRPLPVHPRGPRRQRPVARRELVGCPRVSPEWELNAFRALIKPQARGPIVHTQAGQAWTKAAEKIVLDVAAEIERRLQFRPDVQFPPRGDYFMVVVVPPAQVDAARAMAVVLSKRLPDTWFVVGRLFVLNGRFFRRARGYKLDLTVATNVHLPRGIRAAITGAERCPASPPRAKPLRPSGRAR